MTSDQILNFIQNELSFLQTVYNFSLNETKQNMYTVLQYRKNDIGIDIQVEYLNFGVSVFLVRVEKGPEPYGYYVDNGEKVRIHLSEVLLKNGLLTRSELEDSLHKIYKDLRKKHLTEQQRDQLEKQILTNQTQMLEKYMGFLLGHVEEIFNS